MFRSFDTEHPQGYFEIFVCFISCKSRKEKINAFALVSLRISGFQTGLGVIIEKLNSAVIIPKYVSNIVLTSTNNVSSDIGIFSPNSSKFILRTLNIYFGKKNLLLLEERGKIILRNQSFAFRKCL